MTVSQAELTPSLSSSSASSSSSPSFNLIFGLVVKASASNEADLGSSAAFTVVLFSSYRHNCDLETGTTVTGSTVTGSTVTALSAAWC